jgi:hypothetical protein
MPADMKAQIQMPVDNHEAEMARADLYKMAKYSMKLFQMIQEGQELEGWVQAKITRASDYISSIYHYMEYQMKFGGGLPAQNIEDITSEADVSPVVDTVSEEGEVEIDESMTYEQHLQALLEGKVKKMTAKKAPVKKKEVEEGFDADAKPGDTFKTAKGVATKTSTGVKHTRTKFDYDPGSDDKDDKKAKAKSKKKTSSSVKETSHQASTTMKHVKNPTAGEKKAAKDIKPGVKGYRDRIAMLKSAEKDGRLK